MNRNEKIQQIERKQRELADELEQLRKEEEAPEPQSGEVWELRGSKYHIVAASYGQYMAIGPTGNTWAGICYKPLDGDEKEAKRLGTFDEVYIERSKVAEAVRNTLKCTNASDVRLNIGASLDITY